MDIETKLKSKGIIIMDTPIRVIFYDGNEEENIVSYNKENDLIYIGNPTRHFSFGLWTLMFKYIYLKYKK